MAKKRDRNINIDPNIIIPDKHPKNQENPNAYFDWHPSWNFSKSDFEHSKWSIKKSDIFKEIIPKLVSFEQRKWSSIISDKKHNHWIECGAFSKEAQKRLAELKMYRDELFSLHLTGTLRLFGYIENGIFFDCYLINR